MNDAINTTEDGYETPQLSDYGSIEEWTQGRQAEAINISLIL
ncbi:MAG: hypothetical protein QOJ00_2647 [Actinomycetota bacterium]|jgi:hypothetical protein